FVMSAGFSPFRSYALGCRGPSIRTHPVGGCARYRWDERPSKASRPCSSSNVPSGRPTCACLVTLPLTSGNIGSSFRSTRLGRSIGSRPRGPGSGALGLGGLLLGLPLLPVLLLAFPVVGPPDLVSVSSAHGLLLLGFVPDGQLRAALAGGVDGVQESRPDAGLLQMTNGHDGGSAGRRHHLPQLHRMKAGVPEHLRRSQHG